MRVIIAMSGGVDSSLAAALLSEKGWDVAGITLRLLHQETGFGCCGSSKDIEDARDVCERLGIPHYVLDLSQPFREKVIDNFLSVYVSGETPNPCLACNTHIKFDSLLSHAKAYGADFLATGHYARIMKDPVRGTHRLLRAIDTTKDQSYVLYRLSQSELSKLLFPVGEMTKMQVREKAQFLGLQTAQKPDSQEICFVPNGNTRAFLKSELKSQPGPICNTQGDMIGTHNGVAFYTIGQRGGLGLAIGKPLYVTRIDATTNTIYVGSHEEVLKTYFSVRDLSWTVGSPQTSCIDAHVQIRSHHQSERARIELKKEVAHVTFVTPQRAISPGQAAVFYEGEEVIGGGVIAKVEHSYGSVSQKETSEVNA